LTLTVETTTKNLIIETVVRYTQHIYR